MYTPSDGRLALVILPRLGYVFHDRHKEFDSAESVHLAVLVQLPNAYSDPFLQMHDATYHVDPSPRTCIPSSVLSLHKHRHDRKLDPKETPDHNS